MKNISGVVVQRERLARCHRIEPCHEDWRLLMVLEAALGQAEFLDKNLYRCAAGI